MPMRRIGLAVVIALGFTLAPLAVEAQQVGKVWRVGILATANPRVYDAFVDELHKLGYIDGQSLVLELRSAEGKVERLPTLAAESGACRSGRHHRRRHRSVRSGSSAGDHDDSYRDRSH
jgi:hypothetical protein